MSGTLKELHWLPIEQKIEYKLCFLMHSVVGNVAPSYLNDMVTRVADLPGRACLRSASSGLFDIPQMFEMPEMFSNVF